MFELAAKLASIAEKAPPLVLVIDMDETLVHVDEDGLLHSSSSLGGCVCVYRTEMFPFLAFLRQVFRKRLFLVLWSTGTGEYVKHLTSILGLCDFDLILTRGDSEKAKEEFGVCKSPSYIVERTKFSEWLDIIADNRSPLIPVWAIIDDKARQNTSIDEPYHYTFSPKPLCPRKINFRKMTANVQSLFEYADILIFHLLLNCDKSYLLRREASDQGARDARREPQLSSSQSPFSSTFTIKPLPNYGRNM